jgi:hypothetical protein
VPRKALRAGRRRNTSLPSVPVAPATSSAGTLRHGGYGAAGCLKGLKRGDGCGYNDPSSAWTTGCGYNDFQEQTKAWSEVLNQYQRRADLIPTSSTVKGEANFEQETLTKVIEARAKATSHPGHARNAEQPRSVQQVPGRPRASWAAR